MRDQRNRVQRSYDDAVAPDGDPTQRIKDYVSARPSLAGEVFEVARQLVDNPEVDTMDALLAMFSTGVVYAQDDEGTS